MHTICYRFCTTGVENADLLRKQCLAKAYRTLYNYLDGAPKETNELLPELVNPRYVTVSSLTEIMPSIYDSLNQSSDTWIIEFLKIYDSSILFERKEMLVCPNILSRLEFIYNY